MLVDNGLSDQLLEEMPYTIASAHDFEIAIQVMAQVGISPLMEKKTVGEHRLWLLLPFINSFFKAEMRSANWGLFADDLDRLLPKELLASKKLKK
jgi:hypothetical protein